MAKKDAAMTALYRSPAAGFKTDCQTIIDRFVNTGSVRYEQFTAIWREMGFSFVFHGRETEHELYEFTEEALAIAKGFWLPPYDFQVRVGGLYLVYGLFIKQPLEPPVKIRLTLNQWKQCRSFAEEAAGQKHWDVVFVFRRLKNELDAFHYVFSETEVDPSLRGREMLRDSESQLKQSATDSVLLDYVDKGGFKALEAVQARYEAMKRQLYGDHDPVMQMTDEKAMEKISGMISKVRAAMGRVDNLASSSDPGLQDGSRDALEESQRDDIGASQARLGARPKSKGHRYADLAD